MKRTEIKYIDLPDGTVKILEIKNVADTIDIVRNYGDKVVRDYTHDFPYYLPYRSIGSVQLRRRIKNKSCAAGYTLVTDAFKHDSIIPKEEFSKIIAALKAAGNRLSEIIKANPPEPQEKTIII
jgi:hypothetical protein